MTKPRRLTKHGFLNPPKIKKRKEKVINLEERYNPAEGFIEQRVHLIDYTEGKLAEAKRKQNREGIATYEHILAVYKAQLSKMIEYRKYYQSGK